MYISAFLASVLAIGNFATATDNHHDGHGQRRICPGLKTQDNGCLRYTRGFDITGVTTEVDLAYPQVQSECDCIQECLKQVGTCVNYVWKFSTPESVQSGHRTCTLYSDFNLPVNVTLTFNVSASTNIQSLSSDNNPQQGGLVPQAFKDINLNTTADYDAVSGPIWALSNGQVQC